MILFVLISRAESLAHFCHLKIRKLSPYFLSVSLGYDHDEEEECRLLAECKEHLYDLVVTALHTGFRRNELLSLRPEDGDFARGLVSVRAGYAKNGEERFVLMSTLLHEIQLRLFREAKTSGSPALFRNHQGSPLRTYALHDSFKNAVNRAKLEDFHFLSVSLGYDHDQEEEYRLLADIGLTRFL